MHPKLGRLCSLSFSLSTHFARAPESRNNSGRAGSRTYTARGYARAKEVEVEERERETSTYTLPLTIERASARERDCCRREGRREREIRRAESALALYTRRRRARRSDSRPKLNKLLQPESFSLSFSLSTSFADSAARVSGETERERERELTGNRCGRLCSLSRVHPVLRRRSFYCNSFDTSSLLSSPLLSLPLFLGWASRQREHECEKAKFQIVGSAERGTTYRALRFLRFSPSAREAKEYTPFPRDDRLYTPFAFPISRTRRVLIAPLSLFLQVHRTPGANAERERCISSHSDYDFKVVCSRAGTTGRYSKWDERSPTPRCSLARDGSRTSAS